MDRKDLIEHIGRHPVAGSPHERREAFRALTRIAWRHAAPGRKVSGEGFSGRLHGDYGGTPILYLHGGGYVFGSSETHRGLAQSLMMAARRDVLVLDLPLAPERPWPAQKNAALAAARGLAQQWGTAVTVAGDSAGAHLALLTALTAESVAACVAFSPNTLRDPSLTESRTANASSDEMVDPGDDEELARMTFGELRPEDPEQTLVLQDLGALPPTYISVGTDEVLRDDSLVFADRAARTGAELTLRVRPGFHMEEVFAPVYGPGLRSVQDAGDWLRARSSAAGWRSVHSGFRSGRSM